MKATRKDLVNYCSSRGKVLISGGYCEYQDVTDFGIPTFQNFGLYGWNWTAYEFDTCVICTGYRNTVGGRLKNSNELNKWAHEIYYSRSYEEAKKLILSRLKEEVEKSNISRHWSM